ncbi:MAG: glycosyltransferase, partial [Rhizobiales bacterium]|nr:glycosyltransferase [Hyphomicrobiales bacterium]
CVHWHWTHIGGGELLSKLKRQAEDLNLASRISWKGALSQTDVIEHYRASDVFVLPCRIAPNGDRDGLPNVLMEAQSQALTCLSTPVSGVPELVVDGETGVLVPPDKPQELALALESLCKDPGLREKLGKAAENRVRREFSYEGGIKALLKLFADKPPTAGGSPSETPGQTHPEPLRGAA